MKITLSMVFDAISEHIPLSVQPNVPEFEILRVRLYDGKRSDGSGTLYIADIAQREELARLSRDQAALLFATQTLPPMEQGACGAAVCRAESGVQLLELCTDAMLCLQAWSSRLTETLLDADPLAGSMSLLAQVLHRPYGLIDRNFHLLYGTKGFVGTESMAQNPVLSATEIGQVVNDSGFDRRIREGGVFSYSFPGRLGQCWCCGIETGAFSALLLMAAGTQAPSAGEMALLRAAGEHIARVFPRYQTGRLIRSQNDALHELFRSMMFSSQKYSSANAERTLRNYGWTAQHDYTLVQLGFPQGSRWRLALENLCSQLETIAPGSCAVGGESGIVWVFNRTENGTSLLRREFTEYLNTAVDALGCHAGVSYSFSGLGNIRMYQQQAEAALELGRKADPHKTVFFFREYTLEFIFNRLTSGHVAFYMLHSAVFTMLNYDMKNGTNYFETLRKYAECAGNVTQAAKELFLHRTTLIRRLERINELADRDVTSPDDLFLLQFSFRLINWKYQNCTPEELLLQIERSYHAWNHEDVGA